MDRIYQACLKKDRVNYLLSIFLFPLLFSVLQFILLPVENKILNVAFEKDSTPVGAVIWAVVIFLIVYLTVLYLKTLFLNSFQARIIAECKKRVLEQCSNSNPEQLQSQTSGKFIQSFQQIEVYTNKTVIYANIISSALDLVLTACYLIIFLHWSLLLFLVLLVLLMPLFQGLLSPLMKKQEEILSQGELGISATEEYLQRLELIKSYSLEKVLLHKYHSIVNEERNKLCEKTKYTLATELFQKVIRLIILVGIPLFCYVLVRNDLLQAESVVIASFAFFSLSSDVMGIMGEMPKLQDVKAACKEISAIINDNSQIESEDQGNDREIPQQGLYFSNLSFAYSQDEQVKPIFKNASFLIPDHNIAFLLGENGSGKSTLFQLICGLKQFDTGCTYYNGKKINRSELSKLTSYVSQDSILFPVSIRENIEYANQEIPSEPLEQFLDRLGLLELFQVFPEGLDTVVEEKGKNLSGGQKQLICFCRGIRKESGYLFLDEPTSAMDSSVETRILKACELLSKNRSVVMITHRESSMQLTGQIYRVAEQQILADK